MTNVYLNHAINRISKGIHFWLFSFWAVIYCFIILQDYIYSVMRQTGFYWSEVTLFNVYWLLFIPFSLIIRQIIDRRIIIISKSIKNSVFLVGTAIICSVLHILIFTIIVSFISYLLFSPAHQFNNVLRASISNDLHMTFLAYLMTPLVYGFIKNLTKSRNDDTSIEFATYLFVKKGKSLQRIDVESILYCTTDKPYTAIHTANHQYLLNTSLSKMHEKLDPVIFIRVHKSFILNVHHIQEIKSRGNGDYEAVLSSGDLVRLSRHYRKDWHHLVHAK